MIQVEQGNHFSLLNNPLNINVGAKIKYEATDENISTKKRKLLKKLLEGSKNVSSP